MTWRALTATRPRPDGHMNAEVEAAYKAVLSDAVPTSWRVQPWFRCLSVP